MCHQSFSLPRRTLIIVGKFTDQETFTVSLQLLTFRLLSISTGRVTGPGSILAVQLTISNEDGYILVNITVLNSYSG